VPFIDIPDGQADPEVRVWALRPEMGIGAGALSHAIYEQSILPVRERELARMRIAFINGCAICQQWRKTPGAEGAVTEDEYSRVSEWRIVPTFDERERLVIEYAELFAIDHHAIDDAFFARLRRAFSDAEILDLTVCIGGWLALGRTLHVLGLDDQCALGRKI
jgi:alkylhydroperoxidase family enzyme